MARNIDSRIQRHLFTAGSMDWESIGGEQERAEPGWAEKVCGLGAEPWKAPREPTGTVPEGGIRPTEAEPVREDGLDAH